jgi:hypothetical protein
VREGKEREVSVDRRGWKGQGAERRGGECETVGKGQEEKVKQ